MQQPSVTERCIAAYRQHGNMEAACAEVKVHALTMFKILRMNGVLSISDRLKVGAFSGKVGASAEQEFARLIPHARSLNAVCTNNAGFDFDVNGLKVDVKSTSPIKYEAQRADAKKVWKLKLAKHGCAVSPHVDMFCIFRLHERDTLIGQDTHNIYLVPADLVRNRNTINMTEGVASPLDRFCVTPEQLQQFFSEAVPA